MNFKKSRNLMWIGFAALIQAFIFYTCPYCGYSLMNVRGEVPEHCPKCGKELKSVIGIMDSNKKD